MEEPPGEYRESSNVQSAEVIAAEQIQGALQSSESLPGGSTPSQEHQSDSVTEKDEEVRISSIDDISPSSGTHSSAQIESFTSPEGVDNHDSLVTSPEEMVVEKHECLAPTSTAARDIPDQSVIQAGGVPHQILDTEHKVGVNIYEQELGEDGHAHGEQAVRTVSGVKRSHETNDSIMHEVAVKRTMADVAGATVVPPGVLQDTEKDFMENLVVSDTSIGCVETSGGHSTSADVHTNRNTAESEGIGKGESFTTPSESDRSNDHNPELESEDNKPDPSMKTGSDRW